MIANEILRVDAPLALVARLPSHGPGKVLRVVPLGGAGRHEQLRHLFGIHVFLDRGVRRRPEAVENQQDLVTFDELARLLYRLGRAVAVVIGDEPDVAAVDAALGVDLVEIRRNRLAVDAVGRGRPAVGYDVPDLDLGVAGARVVALLRVGGIAPLAPQALGDLLEHDLGGAAADRVHARAARHALDRAFAHVAHAAVKLHAGVHHFV